MLHKTVYVTSDIHKLACVTLRKVSATQTINYRLSDKRERFNILKGLK